MIQIKNIVKSFDKTTALSDFSCTISKGTVFGLVGSNGSGKSTLLRIMSGVFMADSGEVLIDGKSTFENENVKAECCFISDFPFFFNDSTLNKMAWLYRSIYPNWSEERFSELCKIFPINLHAKIIQMSKGMQRQAALILALSTMPKYLLLDEIFDGLDPVVRQLVKKLVIQDVTEREMTVIIASHNLRELEDICDHIGLLHRGGIIMEKELDEMKLGIHKVQVAFKEQTDPFVNMEIIKKEKHGSLINATIKGDKEEILNKINEKEPIFVEFLPLTLEEVFISEMEGAGYDINNII